MTVTEPSRTLRPELLERLKQAFTAREFAWMQAETKKGDSHRDLYRAACLLKRAGFDYTEFEAVMTAKLWDYYHPIQDREFEQAWQNANTESEEPRGPRYPAPNATLIAELTRESVGAVSALASCSSVSNPERLHTGRVIDRLFPADALLCLGYNKSRAITQPRAFFAGSEGDYQFVVPNPMAALTGKTTDGRNSVRCNDNVGPLTYQVIEFDSGMQDEQAALLIHLSKSRTNGKLADLRMVVFSGGKSLHGWFYVGEWLAKDIEKFRRYACALGADRAMFTPCQFARNPNALRDDGAHQSVIFLK